MRAWEVSTPAPIDDRPLRRTDHAVPEPGRGQIHVRVTVCGVCRTDLHLAEGDLAPKRRGVIPGHEVVGTVEGIGDGSQGEPRRPGRGRVAGHAVAADGACRPGKPLPGPLAGLGRRWWVTRSSSSPTGTLVYPLPAGYSDDERGAAALRRHHRVPGATAGRRAARRAPRHLRIWGLRPPLRPRCTWRKARRAHLHTLPSAQRTGARPGSARGRRRGRRRPSPSTRRSSSAAGGLVPVALAGARPGWSSRSRRDISVRYPGLHYAHDLF